MPDPGQGFSRDKPDPPTRFRANPGQLGQHAALAGLKGGRQPSPPSPRQQAPRSAASGSQRLGLPQMPQPEGNNMHLVMGLMHQNIAGLGRDLPFGLWALHNGFFPSLASPGMEPLDWLDG
jgi:hypothetical protein